MLFNEVMLKTGFLVGEMGLAILWLLSRGTSQKLVVEMGLAML